MAEMGRGTMAICASGLSLSLTTWDMAWDFHSVLRDPSLVYSGVEFQIIIAKIERSFASIQGMKILLLYCSG
jgi:hypothetical protein